MNVLQIHEIKTKIEKMNARQRNELAERLDPVWYHRKASDPGMKEHQFIKELAELVDEAQPKPKPRTLGHEG